jgi:tRNA(adenine34) deaminase
MNQHEQMMKLALEEAEKAASAGDVPVGAVIVQNGKVIAAAHNRREQDHDPTAHAEILAIRQAAAVLGKRRLNDCTMYVTLEPCPMCAGAMVLACLGQCYYGASDERQGCAGSVLSIPQEPAFYHHTPCTGGLLEESCSTLINHFFAKKRTNL